MKVEIDDKLGQKLMDFGGGGKKLLEKNINSMIYDFFNEGYYKNFEKKEEKEEIHGNE